MIDVHKATTKELTEFFNANCDEGQAVKSFKNRNEAMMKVADLIATKGLDGQEAVAPAAKPEGEVKPDSENKGPGGDAHRAAVAKTWLDPEVRAKRMERHGVEVDGVYYDSVRKAFAALDLPDSKHIPFRAKLKAAGTLEGEEAFGLKWKSVPFQKKEKPVKPKKEKKAKTAKAEAAAPATTDTQEAAAS